MSYVNLKDLAEFNKYTTGLGAGTLVYLDKFQAEYIGLRVVGIFLSVFVVVLGVVVMSVKGRIKGDEIDYATEPDTDRRWLFKIVSYALTLQMFLLLSAVSCAGFVAISKLWQAGA